MLASEPQKTHKLHKRLPLSVLLFLFCGFCGSKNFYKKPLIYCPTINFLAMKNSTLIIAFFLPLIVIAQPEENILSNEYFQLLGQHYTPSSRWAAFEESRLEMLESFGPVLLPDWESLGPNTLDTLAGRMLCITFDPTDSDILFAGSGSGGLWKSMDGGDHWASLTDALPSMHVSAVAVNPMNNQEILIGTGVGKIQTNTLQPGVGVLKSTDGGVTWNPTGYQHPLSAIESVYELIWDESLPGKVLLAATNGLYESLDNGETWQPLLPNVRIYDIAINKDNPQIIFVGVQNQGIRRSTDGGESWTTLSSGVPSGSQVSRTNLAICESQPEIIYASLVDANGFGTLGLYKSINGGDSWVKINNAPAVHCQPSNASSCSGWLFSTIGVSPSNPDLIMLGGVQFWRSDDGGESWTWLDYASNGSTGGNAGLTYVDHWDIKFDPEDDSTVYVCSDGGVQKSTDNGQYWVRKSNGLVNAQVYSIATQADDPDFMIGGFHDHGLQRLIHTDGNTTWTRWSLNDGISTVIDHSNPNILYGNIQYGPPRKSLTKGSSHVNTLTITNGINESGPWITPLLQDPRYSNHLYTSSNNYLYKTTNSGSSWQIIHTLPGIQHLAINPLHPDTVYAHTFTNAGNWQFWRSYDAGDSWQQNAHPSIPSWGVTALVCSPHDPGTLYATRNSSIGNPDHVRISVDNGNTWYDITNNLPDIKVFDILVSPLSPNHIYLGTALGVYVSIDGGLTWCEWNNNLPLIETYDVDFSPADSTIRIATMGRGVWKAPALLPEVDHVDEQRRWAEQVNFKTYPNPATEQVTASFFLSRQANTRMELLDVRGQVIRSEQMTLSQGEQVLNFPLKDGRGKVLAPGIYFLRLGLDGKGLSRKIIVQ